MKIFNSIDQIENIDESIIALGNFDGVHLGHQKLIFRAVRNAKSAGRKSAVFTFSNHPRNYLGKGETVKSILYPNEKARILRELGVDYLYNIEFNEEIMNTDSVAFIDDILIDKMNMKEAVCGFNYRFGKFALGTPEVLMREGIVKGYGIHILEPVKIEGEIVSSTLIRNLIESGEMVRCKKFMGRNYVIGGKVVVGNKLGRTLGFPTSNITVDKNMVTPPNGVYVTICHHNGIDYPSITNVGVKPTIGNYKKNVETHIFNFDSILYNKEIRVEFLEKMRDEAKFDSIDELSKQITKDCILAEAYHKK
ncbi:MAG: bifunctional riboflavin kinase/FAD synthetase [Peptostreptococcaceae bacterium]|nr:bifunctional riboflavin kinase/FAD synthetase [Peptostreptococcaceae bacterium]